VGAFISELLAQMLYLCQYLLMLISEPSDFSVVAKHRGTPSKPWRWEIYRAGRVSPIDRSRIQFESATEAKRAGQTVLRARLSECPEEGR
jgi:hypothetical protein